MIVKVEREQGTYVNTEYQRGVKVLRQKRGVKSVKPLNYNNRAFVKLKLVSEPLTFALFEVKARKLNALATEQSTKLLVI